MKSFLLLFFMLFLSICNGSNDRSNCDYLSNKITCQIVKSAEKKGLIVAGTGGGAEKGKINLFNLTFDTKKFLYIKDARKLAIECVDEFLSLINNNTEIQSSLVEHPFTSNGLSIIVISKAVYSYDNEQLCYFIIDSSKIAYYGYNPENPDGWHPKLLHETLEEARKILAEAPPS